VHALVILQHYLAPLLTHIHRRRLATLLDAVASCVSGPALSLTDIGRRFAGPARLRHKIKRSDRLLGNRRLQGEARSIYAALCRVTLARIQEPLILIDWSDLKADQSLHLARAPRCRLGGAASRSTRRSTPSGGSTTGGSTRGFCNAWPRCCRRTWRR